MGQGRGICLYVEIMLRIWLGLPPVNPAAGMDFKAALVPSANRMIFFTAGLNIDAAHTKMVCARHTCHLAYELFGLSGLLLAWLGLLLSLGVNSP